MNIQLTEALRAKIQNAVREAEARTSGEIVPYVVRRSDAYPGARWRLAIAVSFLLGIAVYVSLPHLSPVVYFWAQLIGLGLGYAIGAKGKILRPFLSDRTVDEEVKQRALQAFYSRKLGMTQGRTGVLLFVSLLEHRVEVLADQGIDSKVGEETWRRIVSLLIDRIRAGEFGEGMALAVHECGRVLTEHFPASPDDTNELPDHVVFEDS